MPRLTLLALCLLTALAAHTQDNSGMKKLELNDLSAFRPQAGNWRIVGDVLMDPTVDIHAKPVTVPVAGQKKAKKGAPSTEPLAPQAVIPTSGKGVLLNMNDDKIKSHLLSIMEHGDIELSLELMVPKGSNSGIYLQGRYEVQILDSWGVKSPSFSDIGGIYRNWENTPGQIYMGKAPLTNPAKAPGLWQHMHIVFQAPRFDVNGKKISNARFVSVELNGVKIHDQLEVPLPTGGPVDKNEVASGPLMIQGDHGPVAFRNIRYRILREVKPTLSGISWKVFHGQFKTISEFSSLTPAYTGTGEELTCEVLDQEDTYASIYSGKIKIPESGRYTFGLAFTGGGRLTIDGKTVIDHQSVDHWPLDRGTLELQKGEYNFEVYNYKDAGWMPPRLALYAAIENGKEYSLHAYNSYPPDPNPVSSILVNPGSEVKMLRAFLDFNGDRAKRLTHTIGVGEPSGIHYAYDLQSGNIACVWRGEFVDATPMWHDRGDGSFRPLGSALYTFKGQPLAVLQSGEAEFPASENYVGKGYEKDPVTGRPTFNYTYRGAPVTSKIIPGPENKSFTHEVTVKSAAALAGLKYKLAEGSVIQLMPDGSYAIDDKRYYLKVNSGGVAQIRKIAGKDELIISFESDQISYNIIW